MNNLFKVAKRLLPRISETEMIALRSGTVSIDRNIMENSVKTKFDFSKLNNNYDFNYLNHEVNILVNSCKGNVFEMVLLIKMY